MSTGGTKKEERGEEVGVCESSMSDSDTDKDYFLLSGISVGR